MEYIVASNLFLKERILSLRQVLQSRNFLRLYTNNVTPSPASVTSYFAEASFPNYAARSLDTLFGNPFKVQDGEYVIETDFLTFTCTAPSAEIVYGWFITNDGRTRLAARFADPVTLGTGIEVTFKIALQIWSLSLLL